MEVPFGPLAPDLGEVSEGHVVVAQNVLPLRVGYKPMQGLATADSAVALPAACRGMRSIILRDGSWKVYAFTATTIEVMDDEYAWTELANGYNCTSDYDWCSEHFGSFLLATNTTDGLLAYNVEAGGAVSAIADANDPAFIFVVANVVVALNCLDDSGNRDNRLIRNSDFNDHTDWKGGAADYQPLEDGGALICGGPVSATAAIVLQESAARLMRFGNAGGGALYSLDNISSSVGCIGATSFVVHDNAAHWIASDGFCRFTLAGGIERIGAGFIDDWFFGTVDQTRLHLVQAAYDPFNKMIWWRFPRSTVASDSVLEDMIGYSWQWKRWVTLDIDTAYLSRIATPGITIDGGMDDYGVLDDIDIPLDSRLWQGSQAVFGALDSALKFATFTGANLAAQITAATMNSPVSGKLSRCTPITDAPCTIELGLRDDLEDAIAYKAAASKGRAGSVPLDGRGKNVTLRFNVAASSTWTFAKGIDHLQGGGGARL